MLGSRPRWWSAVLACAVLLGLMQGAAGQVPTPHPGYIYRVTGVAANDALNVRSFAGTDGEIVGRLPPDGRRVVVTGVAQEIGSSVWWEIVHPAGPRGTGWVNARFLAMVDTSALPEADFPLLCVGTEPFWSLTIRGAEAHQTQPGIEGIDEFTWRASPWLVAVSGWRFALRLEGEGGEPGWMAVLRAEPSCTDGMSDVDYPFDTVVLTPQGYPLAGCCLRAP